MMRWLDVGCPDITTKVHTSGCDHCTVKVVSSDPAESCYLIVHSLYNSSNYTEHTSPAACGVLSVEWFMDQVQEHRPDAVGKIVDLSMACGSTIFRHLCQVAVLCPHQHFAERVPQVAPCTPLYTPLQSSLLPLRALMLC